MDSTPQDPHGSAGPVDPPRTPDTDALYRTLLSLTHSLEAVLEVLKPGKRPT